jgi:hypothetical protein
MLAASSFDDILAITLFSVFSSIAIDTTLAKYPDPSFILLYLRYWPLVIRTQLLSQISPKVWVLLP